MNPDRNQLDFDSGVMRLKEPRFLSQSILKVRVIAKRNAKCAHAASEETTRTAAESCRAQFTAEIISFHAADAV